MIVSDTTNKYGVRIQTFADGSSHVVESPEVERRREIATLMAKVRINQAMGVESPVMRARIAELTK